MIENGQIVDLMRVVVGKAGSSTQTPMLASTIYYATLNPYWHVDAELVRSLIAENVLTLGLGYLKAHGWLPGHACGRERRNRILRSFDDRLARARGCQWQRADSCPRAPGACQFHGSGEIRVPERLHNIYLHDTPVKDLFAKDDRDLSHGCIRLQDAERLAHWMLGRDPLPVSNAPEQNVELPTPVLIYVTYLTAQAHDGQLSFSGGRYLRA